MARESIIERRSCRLIQQDLRDPNCTPKMGMNGDPDRLVLLGEGCHYWLEFKQLKGRLRSAQVERIKQLRARGELVGEPRSVEAALSFHIEAKRKFMLEAA